MVGILSGFTVAFLLEKLYSNNSSLHLEESNPNDPSQSSSSSSNTSDQDDSLEFAPSIEEQELYSLSKSNLIARVYHSITSTLTIYILEPLGTTKRFIFLALLFIPVILTSPMLLVGRRREGGRRRGRRLSKKDKGQRWGAVWWFGFLVKQMERAGPTFIKVSIAERVLIEPGLSIASRWRIRDRPFDSLILAISQAL